MWIKRLLGIYLNIVIFKGDLGSPLNIYKTKCILLLEGSNVTIVLSSFFIS